MIPGTERWWGWWPADIECGHLLRLASALNPQIHEKASGGKGLLAKSHPKATHHIWSPEAKEKGLKSNPAAWPHMGKVWLVGSEHLTFVRPFPALH